VNCLYAENSPERRFFKHLFGQIAVQLNTEPLPPERESLWTAIDQAADQQCRLVVLMDEFDVIVQNKLIDRALFSFLRASSHDITYVISSRENVVDWFVDAQEVGSPFWNIFKQVYVGPFKHEEAVELIRKPAERSGVPFSEADVEWILERGGHLPLFLQIAACNAFPRKGTREEWDFGFRQEADPHFEYLLDFLPEKERLALAALRRSERIDERMKQMLLRKGIVLFARGGELKLFCSVIGEKLEERLPKVAEGHTATVLNKLFQ
jgi:ATP/maltotriose-dependent transcriptional regulator MalT